MAKPAYSLVYAILIIVGVLAVVAYQRLSSSDAETPKVQATVHHAAAARQGEAVAEDARAEREDKPAQEAEAEKPPVAARGEQPATAKDEETK